MRLRRVILINKEIIKDEIINVKRLTDADPLLESIILPDDKEITVRLYQINKTKPAIEYKFKI